MNEDGVKGKEKKSPFGVKIGQVTSDWQRIHLSAHESYQPQFFFPRIKYAHAVMAGEVPIVAVQL